MNLMQFRNFNVDKVVDIDELVAGMAFGKALRAEFEALQLEEPEYIDTQLKALRREIISRNADSIEARKRQLKAQIDAHKSREEKRKELEAELAKLESPTVTIP